MNWIIEKWDGKILEEGKSKFIPESFKRIYFSWPGHGCGFMQDGKFFADNTVYDFKIDIEDAILKPFQNKTGMLHIPSNKNSIVSWNIGYELIKDLSYEKYFVSIYPTGQITFSAEKNGDKKNIKLR